jgi:hypothetical protein
MFIGQLLPEPINGLAAPEHIPYYVALSDYEHYSHSVD